MTRCHAGRREAWNDDCATHLPATRPTQSGETPPRPSPEKLGTQLPDAGIARTRYLAELAAADITRQGFELGVIENVEEFGADLEPHRLLDVGPF
jgi:hypothetical protein